MLDSSLQQPSQELLGGGSFDSGMKAGALAVAGHNYSTTTSPALPGLPRNGSRNVYLQRRGLALHSGVPGGGAGGGTQGVGPLPAAHGAGSRNPFALHTERAKGSGDGHPGGLVGGPGSALRGGTVGHPSPEGTARKAGSLGGAP